MIGRLQRALHSGKKTPQSGQFLAGAYFLTFFAAGGVTYPYLNLFYQSAGMTNQQIGVLAALPTVMTVFAVPLWAGLADRLNLHRILLPGLLVGTLLPALLLPTATQFWTLALLILAFNLFNMPAVPLAENAVVTILGDQTDRYGNLRLWGSIGFGASSWLMGYISGWWGLASMWWVYIALILPTILVAARLPIPQMTAPTNYLTSLRQMTRNRRWLGFLGAVLLVGTGFSMYDNFYAIHFKAMGASSAVIGLLFVVATASELPVFLISAALIKRLSLRGVILGAFVMFALRGFATALAPTPGWGVAVQLLHGTSFSALWAASVLYVNRIAPPGLGASAQALFLLAFLGLGKAIGALVGAQLYDSLGGPSMFAIGAGVALIGALMFAFTEYRTDQMEAHKAHV